MSLTLFELYGLENQLFMGMVIPPFCDDLKHTYYISDGDVVQNILYECGHFETLYTNPTNFNRELVAWSKSKYASWEDLFKTTIQKYELTHNYDRMEEWEETREHSESGENSESGTNERITSGSENIVSEESKNATVGETGRGNTSNGNSLSRNEELYVSAYNGGVSYQPKEKKTMADTGSSNATNEYETEQTFADSANGTRSATSNDTQSQTDNRDGAFTKTGNDKFTRTVRAYGNIGVTTAQQMIKEEREIALFSIVQHITNDFKERFCIMIY